MGSFTNEFLKAFNLPTYHECGPNAQDYVEVADIEDGTIITTDERYVKVLEITPINLPMKRADDQDVIYDAFRAWNRSSPSRFTIKVETRKTPIDEYRENFKDALAFEESEKVREFANDHINFTQQLGMMQATTTRTCLIIEYEPEDDYFKSRTKEDKLRFLESTKRQIEAEFASMGNTVVEHKDENRWLTEFLYDYYNRKLINKEPLLARATRFANDSMMATNNYDPNNPPELYIKDIVCPRSLNFKESPDYVIIDGLYCSYYCVDGNGYPDELTAPNGWLSALLNFGYGYDVDIRFEKVESDEAMKIISKMQRQNAWKAQDRDSYARDFEEVQEAQQSVSSVRAALKRNGEELYYMHIMIAVYAYNKEELWAKRASLERFARKEGISLIDFKRIQQEGFFSMAPLNKMTDIAKNLAKHNVPTSVVTASYPFTSFSLHDKEGILVGRHAINNSLVIYDPFDSEKYANANMTILGAPGKGKSFTLMTMTSRFRALGIQVFILSPEKQDEFERVCDALDGEFVDISASSKTRINPFEIWPSTSEVDAIVNGKKSETNWMTEKVETLSQWLEMLVPGIRPDEKAKLKGCIVRTYKKRGIDGSLESIYEDAALTKKKDMPIFSDLMDEVRNEQGVTKGTKAILEQFVEENGPFVALNGQTNVNLNNKYIVFGLERVSREMKAPMMFILLSYIWSMAKADKTKKKCIAIDEGSLLINGKDQYVADFIENIFTLIRGRGGSAIFATQSISDLYKNGQELGNKILACCHSHILMGMESTEIRLVKDQLGLSGAEEASIKDFRKSGEALLCAGGTHIPVIIKASQNEADLYTTRRADLERIAREKMQAND